MAIKRLLFLSFFFLFLYLKSVEVIGAILIGLVVVAGRERFELLKRAVISIAFFNSAVSIGYLIYGLVEGIDPTHYLIYINLKVVTLTYFVFLFFSRVDPVQFLAFSPELSHLFTIAVAQIVSYRQTFSEFRLAFKARVENPRQFEEGFIKRVFFYFLEKSLKDSRERTLAMKSRGFFDGTSTG
jgi:cobalt/nickel transport system permease protein